MKSVGEVMAIGRRLEETLQKALRMTETGARGLVLNDRMTFDDLRTALAEPTEQRIFAVAEAIRTGISVDEIHEITHIDHWFLDKIANIVAIAERLRSHDLEGVDRELMLEAKPHGFSDTQIGIAVGADEDRVRESRHEFGLHPAVKQIDTLAAEYPAATNYLYLTYNGTEDDVTYGQEGTVMILGPGAYRIGSSVEFDWCCVNAARTLRDLGYRTLMVNHNPETVSTDYDECDRLYFDELSFEAVSEIYRKETPLGIMLSMGGQVPNNLALRCDQWGMRVLGTSPRSIDRAENRHSFSSLLERLGVPQPAWQELSSVEETQRFANHHGYPVIVRPSYVLSGAAMAVAGNDEELTTFLDKAVDISPDHPVVVSQVHRKRQGDRRRRRGARRRAGVLGGVGARGERRRPLGRRHPGAAAAAHLPGNHAADPGDHHRSGAVHEHHRALQHPVPGQGQPGDGHRVQSARVPLLPIRLQGAQAQLHRRRHPGDDGAAGGDGRTVASRSRLRWGQGPSLLLHPARGRRPHPRRGDGLHR